MGRHVVSQLDIDTKRRLVGARRFVGAMLCFTVAGFVDATFATIVLATNAFVWLTWFINKQAAIREMTLLEQGDE